MITIDKGMPMPARTSDKKKWPWAEMAVGDSFFAAGYSLVQNQMGNPRFSVTNGRLKVPGSKWITRTVTENGIKGVRVWRIA